MTRGARAMLRMLLVLLAVTSVAERSNAQSVWPKNLSGSGSAQSPALAVDATGTIINVVWQDKSPGNYDVFFSRSTDGGLTFSTPQNLSQSGRDSLDPQIAVDSAGNINVVWREDVSGNYAVLYTRSADGGAIFSTSKSIPVVGSAYDLHIAVDSKGNIGTLYKVEAVNYVDSIVYAHSTDGGLTFSSTTLHTGYYPVPIIPRMDSHDAVNVVWVDDADGNGELYFSHSVDGGATFSSPASVGRGGIYQVKIAVAPSGDIGVLWYDNGWSDYNPTFQGEIYFSRSTDGGVTWPQAKLLSSGDADYCNALAVDPSGNFDVVWAEDSGSISFAGGDDFTKLTSVSQSGAGACPQIAVDTTETINVVWNEGPSTAAQVFYSRSTDGGATFRAPDNLSNSLGNAALAAIAGDGAGKVHVLWTESPSGSAASDVFFSIFPDTVNTDFKLTVADGCANGACGWFAGAGTVTSNPAGIDCGATCSASFPKGSTVTLTASPDNSSYFEGWSGACSGTGDCTVNMDANRTVSAKFRTLHLTWNIKFAGTGSGTIQEMHDWFGCTGDCEVELPIGDYIRIAAYADLNSIFAGWTGPCSGAGECAGQFNSDETLIATFNLDAEPPAVSIATPAGGSMVSGSAVAVNANATDNRALVGVQFKMDGGNIGAEDTSYPFSVTWDTTATSTGTHTLTAVARDAAGNTGTASVTVMVNNPDTTPPTISLTAPASGSTVSGTSVTVSASSTDNTGVVAVQFKLDGTNLGGEATTAPYTVVWDSTKTPNGTHTLTASARDAAGNVGVTVALAVTVANSTEFALAPAPGSPTSATVTAGGTANFNLTVAPTAGFTGPISFACTGAPVSSTCTVTPNPARVSGTAASAIVVSVTTAPRFGTNRVMIGRTRSGPAFPLQSAFCTAWLMAGVIMRWRGHRGRREMRIAGLAAICAMLALMLACGGGPPPSTTYTITVTGTSGTVSHAFQLLLTVN